MFLNERIQEINESATLAVKERASKLRAQGKEIVDFGTGEPDIDTPQYVKDGALEALNLGKTKYTAVAGIPELREAIAKKFTEENGIPSSASQVIVTAGGKQALFSLFDVTLNPGDEVVIPAPYWVSYPEMVRLCRGKPVIVEGKPENGYRITPADLERAITNKTKIVVINSPSNPTGAAYTAEQQKEIGKVLAKSKALICSDEVYEKITFDGFTHHSFAAVCPELLNRIVTVNAFSKTFSMTGWRVGYATGPQEIISAMIRHQGQTTSNACSIAQYAALAALKKKPEFLPSLVESYRRRRDLACDLIAKSKGLTVANKPEGAFYLFVRFDKLIGKKFRDTLITGSEALALILLEEGGVAVVPGAPFGDDKAFRISVATTDHNVEKGISQILSVVSELS